MRARPPRVKRLSPIVTIACGQRLLGQPYEIVAVDTSEGLWVYTDSGPLGFSEGQSVLPGAPFGAITVQLGWGEPPARSHLYGVLGANVASVKVIFHHRGQQKRVVRTPTTALVSGELAADSSISSRPRRSAPQVTHGGEWQWVRVFASRYDPFR